MAKIYNCPLCSKFYDNRRSLNAHMLKAHYDDYKAHGCSIDAYNSMDGMKEVIENISIRPLDLNVEAEKLAYDEGYRFVDDSDDAMCYTVDEAKEKGWL